MDKFGWINFYTEFATKLLPYKNERQVLIAKLKKIYEEIEMKFPKMERNGSVIDIDPFTVFGLFNKGITKDNRKLILDGIAKEFEIKENVPSDFEGIPVVNNLRATFFPFVNERGENDISNLWDMFEAAVSYADDSTEVNKTNFEKMFDKVIQQKCVRRNITMGLFWIRPNNYISLDVKSREFIISEQILETEYLEKLNYFRDMPSGKQYRELCQTVLESFKNDSSIYKSFSEISLASWNASIKEKEDIVSEETNNTAYWPSLEEYNPNLGFEEWVKFLQEDKRLYPATLEMLKALLELGGEGTCKRIAELLGEHSSACISRGKMLGRRVKDMYHLPPCLDGEKERDFAIPFLGRYVNEDGKRLYAWRLRPELKEALESMKLGEIKSDEETTDIGKNTILYGPPGTGKTYNTIVYAVAIIENKKLQAVKDEDYADVLVRYNEYKAEGLIEFTTFHQSYGYEEFIEGIKPVMNNGSESSDIQYQISSGIFKRFCEKAENSTANNFVFVIDEINRGNISKIFGELITLVESTKRIGQSEGMKVKLPYSQQLFGVPDNVYLIGTMNTADRSIATIDTALRRRFHFKEMLPDAEVLDGIYVDDISIKDMLIKMNKRIAVLYDREHTLGHSYFLPLKIKPTVETLAGIFSDHIIPLLQEYFYEDYEKIRLVFGDNNKPNREEQFIVAVSNDYNELFGNVEYDFDDTSTYEINMEAFENIEAYRLI